MKMTTLQKHAMRYFYLKMLGQGHTELRPQRRVIKNLIQKGLLQSNGGAITCTLEGISYITQTTNLPPLNVEMDEEINNVVKMADHKSKKGWAVHRFTETAALSTHIQNLINFYGAEAVQWQVNEKLKKVA